MDENKIKEMVEKILAEKKPAEEKPTIEANLTELVDKMADKIVEAITAKKGGNSDDQRKLKEKLFNTKNGFNAIQYPEDLSNLTDEQKIVTFFKAFVNHKTDEESNKVFKALVEGATNDGGYLVPAPLATEIFRVLPDLSVMRQIGRVIPMTSKTLDLSTLTARPVAYWTAEYASKSTTSADFDRVTLTANKLVCLLPVSHELIADANIDMANFVISLFTEAIAIAEDAAFFGGSGTGQPKGINQESLTSVNAGGNVGFDHVIALMDSVPSRAAKSPRAAFVGHKYAKRILRSLKDLNGMYIWRDGGYNNGQGNKLPDTLYGYPFYEQNDLAQTELYFGDWSAYLIGDRQQITVDMTNEGGDAWRRDSTEYKAVERVDGRTVLTKVFAKITNLK